MGLYKSTPISEHIFSHVENPLNGIINNSHSHTVTDTSFFGRALRKPDPNDPKNKSAMHFIKHGTFLNKDNKSDRNPNDYDNDEKESVKEETMMSYIDHLFRPLNEDGEGNATGVAQGTGLGTPKADANKLFQIPINQYSGSDSNFIGDGESEEILGKNIPAILAAKQAGGVPHSEVVKNGINKRSGGDVFKLKPLKDDFGQNG